QPSDVIAAASTIPSSTSASSSTLSSSSSAVAPAGPRSEFGTVSSRRPNERIASARAATAAMIRIGASELTMASARRSELGALDVLVDADQDALPALDLQLVLVGGAADLALEESLLDPRHHPAHGPDPAEIVLGLFLERVGEALDVVRAGQRIDRLGDAQLVGDHLLRAQRDLDRLVAGQREGLVHRGGVQRLGAA